MNTITTLTKRFGALFARLFDRRGGSSRRREVHGEIRVRLYDMNEVRRLIPEWGELDNSERLDALHEYGPDPYRVTETTNVTLNDMHEHEAQYWDVNSSTNSLDASHVALGTDGTAPDATQSGLQNEQYRTTVDDSVVNGRDLETNTLLSETDGNTYTYEEIGLVTAGSNGTFLNRASLDSVQKDDQTAAEFEVFLEFRPA